ncbi:winged helix-turn-helix transcriptional regulator [Streptomyces sp. NPDC090052]|uniref:winged helix-turn-helix transcriptional regulator n=1 Tax=Streptomyces sp. NPDC090052 TaxID=3365931 RepID=UPI0038259751
MLTRTLRPLQGYSLVDRYAEAGKVEYVLTDLGRTLVKPIAALTGWAHGHGAAVVEFQESKTDQVDSASPSRPATAV